MQRRHLSRRVFEYLLALTLLAGGVPMRAQARLSATDLERLVQRIALYPDPLLAQVFSAATYSDQIPEAAKWADEHHYLAGPELATAISSDHLPWDPSVQGLLPFPSVLEMMAADMTWTAQLGNAVLVQKNDVMQSVQRLRHRAWEFGYLRTGAHLVVSNGLYIHIMSTPPNYYIVPAYDPAVVFVAPKPGFVVGTAIGLGFGVTLTSAFRPWGWGGIHIAWDFGGWYIDDRLWGRTWANRASYIHPYRMPRYEAGKRVETHELIARSAREREEARLGHAPAPEEHHHR
ncbi:MAG TPA: DUF3300 domain-containing protein [Bryobacteraceae bacterium]|nr:DUF3300 domain-containing protein [Bryobacteraceae bacterium]